MDDDEGFLVLVLIGGIVLAAVAAIIHEGVDEDR
jgi:hypothetical protein